MDIHDVSIEELTDIRDIRIDPAKSATQRYEAYCEQVSNPYFLRLGEYVIKLRYSDTQVSLEDLLEQYMKRITEGV
jgi:hypothetical protein